MTAIPKQSLTLPNTWLRTAECLSSWRSPCTNQRLSLLCSTWRASPSTDTQTGLTNCHSQSLCCTTCRTIVSTYEGLCPSGAGHRDRNVGQGHTTWPHTVNLEPQAAVMAHKGDIEMNELSLTTVLHLFSRIVFYYYYFHMCVSATVNWFISKMPICEGFFFLSVFVLFPTSKNSVT